MDRMLGGNGSETDARVDAQQHSTTNRCQHCFYFVAM
jgi:hypothetical protein